MFVQHVLLFASLAMTSHCEMFSNRQQPSRVEMIEQSKRSLLRTFGLSERDIREQEAREPHKFMRYIYDSYRKDKHHRMLPPLVDSVKGCVDLGETRHQLANFSHTAYKFDISTLKANETLIESQLKVLLKRPKTRTAIQRLKVRLVLYGVLPRTKKSDKKRELPLLFEVSSKVVSLAQGEDNRWVTFDVMTYFVQILQKQGRKFAKFVVRAKPVDGGTEISLLKIGLESSGGRDKSERSLLALFTSKSSDAGVRTSRRKRGLTAAPARNSNTSVERRRRKRGKGRKKGKGRKNKKRCRRKPMRVDFEGMNWKWLLSPPDFESYYCHGTCEYPMTAHLQPTNHATIQSIVRKRNNDFVPAPCCVPTEFEDLPILYFLNNTTIIDSFKDMIVKSCGCR